MAGSGGVNVNKVMNDLAFEEHLRHLEAARRLAQAHSYRQLNHYEQVCERTRRLVYRHLHLTPPKIEVIPRP